MAATPARRCAHAVLGRVLHDGAYADRAFRAEADRLGLDPRERAFAQRLAYGAVQRLRTVDWVVEQLVDRPLAALDPPVLDAIRLGVLQIAWLDGVPPHAAVDQTVELVAAAAPRARGFANAVMRSAARGAPALVAPLSDSTPEDAALTHSHPDWLAAAWWDTLGAAAARALMNEDNEPAESAVRANALRGTRDSAIDALVADGADARPGDAVPEAIVITGAYDVHGSKAFAAGMVMPQSRASMLVGHACAPDPGERILDMCAAPGAKATHIAALMGDAGEVVAVERNPARADELRTNCERLGARSVSVRTADARHPVEPEGFDRILLDAPCSDLGTLQSRPDARWRHDPRSVAGLADLQRGLLDAAAGQLRPGGVLVYSTCTISSPENGAQIDGLLDRRPELAADALGHEWPTFASRDDPRYLQLLPHRDRTDGFFVARLRRTG
ncbi:MAG: 16S rRNA (cytosine(967)-C(5))-methyltransferase RsmB [Actinobacteria bacterium]|nr:16S rRNA (cytosine(967)-C(5))-methyltransferase RsmB [Actinomycetota bacterium]